jgi:hypothetical protein
MVQGCCLDVGAKEARKAGDVAKQQKSDVRGPVKVRKVQKIKALS